MFSLCLKTYIQTVSQKSCSNINHFVPTPEFQSTSKFVMGDEIVNIRAYFTDIHFNKKLQNNTGTNGLVIWLSIIIFI
jgi:hypothetical protein